MEGKTNQSGRSCKGTYYEKGVVIPFEQGTFLLWGQDFIEFEDGVGNYTIAIVELPEGKVVSVPPTDITFTDRGRTT